MNFPRPRRRNGQTFVFFLVAFGTVFLLCGLGLDSGLYYLSKVRLQRATDASVITGVQNFYRPLDEVADIMRNIAVANYVDLADISEDAVLTTSTTPKGETEFHYAYNGTDDDGNITHAITNTITRAQEGNVTEAKARASAPYQTYFMRFTGIGAVTDLDLIATSTAERRPRLITLVLDRSGSMLTSGSKVLPSAVLNFMGDGSGVNSFDQTTDEIAIVSYSSFARYEMPHTTNFVEDGSNLMYKADGDNKNGKQVLENPEGMKFSGVTAADEGMRMALEKMRLHPAYNNDQYDKYIVFMTDGAFNSVRSLYSAPTYTNRIIMSHTVEETNISYFGYEQATNYPWVNYADHDDPTTDKERKEAAAYINYLEGGNEANIGFNYFYYLPNLSSFTDTSRMVGSKNDVATPRILTPLVIGDQRKVGEWTGDGATNLTHDVGKVRGTVNVWLPPGSVAIHRKAVNASTPDPDDPNNDTFIQNYFSYYTNSAVNIPLGPGEYIDLVLPGYVIDAVSSGYMTLRSNGDRNDNFSDSKSYWPSHPEGEDPSSMVRPDVASTYFVPSDISAKPNSTSLYRNWMLRNRANLLWDYVLFKPEDARFDDVPVYTQPPPPAGLFYPGGMFVWSHNNYISQTGGNNYQGIPRASTNFVATTPVFAGNTFFSKDGQLINASDWQNQAPAWLLSTFDTVMSVQYSPDPEVAASGTHNYPVWRPWTYDGHRPTNSSAGVLDQIYYMTNGFPYDAATNPIIPPVATLGSEDNTTAGWCYVYENGVRHLHMNSMSFNSRPMYFFDQKDARWEAITNWDSSSLMTGTGDWKARRYAKAARNEEVTIYTINFKGGNVDNLKEMSNDPSSPAYDKTEPEGEHITTTTGNDLSEAFEEISKKIRATLIN